MGASRTPALLAGAALVVGLAMSAAVGAGAVPGSKSTVNVRAGLVIRTFDGMTVGQYVNADGTIGYGFASSAPATAARVSRTIVVKGKKVVVSGLAVTPVPFRASDAAATAASIAANGICDKKLLLAAGVPAAIATMINDQAGEQDSCTPRADESGLAPARLGSPQAWPTAGDIFYTTCMYNPGAYHAYSTGCLNQKMAQGSGANAYVLDQIENDGVQGSCTLEVVESADYYQYDGSSPASSHQVFWWKPDARHPVGNPYNWSATASLDGQSITASGEVYPDVIEPWFAWGPTAQTGVGDYWYTNSPTSNDGIVGSPSVDEEHTSDYGSIDAGIFDDFYADNC